MSDNLGDLGGVCVLDAHNLQVGNHVEIDRQVLIVESIIDEAVFLQPVIGRELWRYRLNKMWRKGKVLIVALALWLLCLSVYFARYFLR